MADINHTLDTTGLICPEPVMMLHKVIRKAEAGDIIEVIATDPATTRDIPNFCRHLGHTLVSQETITADNNNTNSSANINDNNDICDDTHHTSYRYLLQKKSL